jgi:hypothetical protein
VQLSVVVQFFEWGIYLDVGVDSLEQDFSYVSYSQTVDLTDEVSKA